MTPPPPRHGRRPPGCPGTSALRLQSSRTAELQAALRAAPVVPDCKQKPQFVKYKKNGNSGLLRPRRLSSYVSPPFGK